jgi:two-component system, response regulator YesN
MPHILIVDDQRYVRETLWTLLKTQEPDWELSEASDGTEAVEVFRKTEPEVVVLDIAMRGMNGVAAAYEIRKITPEAQIVFICCRNHFTFAEASLIVRLLRAGAFVPKVKLDSVLIPTIKRLLTVQ